MPVNDKYPKINLREYPDYTPRNTLGLTLKAAAVCAGSGIVASAVKNSLEKAKGAGFFHPKTGYYTFMFGMYTYYFNVKLIGRMGFFSFDILLGRVCDIK